MEGKQGRMVSNGKTYCKDITTPREGKTVYIGSDWKEVSSKRFEKNFTLRAGYEITERTNLKTVLLT